MPDSKEKTVNLSEPLDYEALPEFAEEIKKELQKSIIAQDRAIEEVVNKFITSIFADPEKPKGIFFLAGPTGVGKTELVKIFAKHIFGDKNALTRVDCNKLKHEHSDQSLIGSPPGYVGFQERNRLFDQRQIDKWGFFKKIAGDFKNDPAKKQKFIDKFSGRLKEEIRQLIKSAAEEDHVIKNFEANKAYFMLRNKINEEQADQYINNLKSQLAAAQNELKKKQKMLADFENNADALLYTIKAYYENLLKKISILRESKTQNQGLAETEEKLENLEKELNYIPGAYESILLFDEFEKAHPVVYDLVLSIIDEARLTLSDNSIVKFNNTYVFFTSNIGSEQIKKILTGAVLGFTTGTSSDSIDRQIYESTLHEIDKFFLNRTEILGRIGKENITVFRPLNEAELKMILEKCTIPNFQQFIKNKYNINLVVEESFKERIIKESSDKFNRPLGARPLLRITKNRLQEPLCILLLKGAIKDGDTVVVSWKKEEKKGKFVFRKILV